MAVVISSWKWSVKWMNSTMTCCLGMHLLVMLILLHVHTTRAFLGVFLGIVFHTVHCKIVLIYYTKHLSVSMWLCLYPAPPSTHLSSLFSLSTTPLPLKYLITCNGNIPLITPCKLASLLSTIKMKIPIT